MPEQEEQVNRTKPVYPLTAGLSPRVLSKAVGGALERVPELAEWLDPALRARRHWPGWHEALAAAHSPRSEADLAPSTPARGRLAYDEIPASQLAGALGRAPPRPRPRRGLARHGGL